MTDRCAAHDDHVLVAGVGHGLLWSGGDAVGYKAIDASCGLVMTSDH